MHPEPHEGLGVACYAWMSSPLRRYVDLVNQWQLVAALSGQRAPFARNSERCCALRAFEVTYARYDEHQRAMETYWMPALAVQEAIRDVRGAWSCARIWCACEGAAARRARAVAAGARVRHARARSRSGQSTCSSAAFRCIYRETLAEPRTPLWRMTRDPG